ncbi:sugar ABC transporter substrate-binding protein [Paenibacillus sp. IB182496]|uniref:Sugar ABC transporter substrate-binding protein n=1 Tax=Paenibacillus sabuli TaxID=2772509 RepID=A0A927BNF3_9BACL|nr:sugar ABC transporter substrate-binding protein [Paenibacillus sabuli]MBD2843746.1 sugar ABC transporter substrate-binding protein [Paenibacillus sabuli]
MQKPRILKALSLLAAFALTLVLLAACSGGNNDPEGNGAGTNGAQSAGGDGAKGSGGGAKSGGGAGGKTEQVTVKFANFSGSGDPAPLLEQMRETFEAQNPDVKVEIETIGFGDYFTQMQTRVASGTAPDAYELNYENFVSYAKKGVLLDLQPMFEAAGFDKSVLYEQALDAFQADGVQYGMPASFSNVVLIYNKDLFDQAQTSYPTIEWTWKEMNEAAVSIRALGDDIFGISQGVQFFEFFKAAQQNGGSLLNEDQTAFTINTPENVETLQYMVDRIQKSNVMPTEAQMSGIGDWDLFKAGRLGMILTGVWAFPDFVQNVEFPWDIAVEPGNVQKATHFFSNGLVINKDSKVAEAAYRWIAFMSASKEAAQIRVDGNWELPAVTYPDVLEAYLAITPPDNRQAVFDSLEYLVTPPVIEQFAEMNDTLTLHLAAAAQGAKTPQQALDDAQQELTAKIKLE